MPPSPDTSSANERKPAAQLLDEINALPADWHGAGSFMPHVLATFARLASRRTLRHTAETGAGRSTLLLSHLSDQHTVFSLDQDESLSQVRESPLLHRASVSFVDGPTQVTLPGHAFPGPLDLVLLDGPHAFPFVELEYYHFYPKVATGGLLIIDDIHIPTIRNLHRFLCECEMWRLLEVSHTTSFFERTAAPTFDPLGDSWWEQGYNKRRFPQFPSLHLHALPLLSKVLPKSLKNWLMARAGKSAAAKLPLL